MPKSTQDELDHEIVICEPRAPGNPSGNKFWSMQCCQHVAYLTTLPRIALPRLSQPIQAASHRCTTGEEYTPWVVPRTTCTYIYTEIRTWEEWCDPSSTRRVERRHDTHAHTRDTHDRHSHSCDSSRGRSRLPIVIRPDAFFCATAHETCSI